MDNKSETSSSNADAAPPATSIPPQEFVNPQIQKVITEIKNRNLIVKFTDKITSGTFKTPPAPAPIKTPYYENIRLDTRCETNRGSNYTIDVQPDFRFPLKYIAYSVIRRNPDLAAPPHPQISIPSLCAYYQMLFVAFILTCDIRTRSTMSNQAETIQDSTYMKRYYQLFLELAIPDDLFELMLSFSPLIDPNRPNFEYIPSLACGIFAHDFGRLVPPQIFLAMHNTLATANSGMTPSELIRQFHNTHLFTVLNRHYCVTHFIQGYYTANQATRYHQNWLSDLYNNMLLEIFGPIIDEQATMTPIEFDVINNNTTTPNNYIQLLGMSPDQIPKMTEFLRNASAYIKTTDQGCYTIQDVMTVYGGLTIISPTIESKTLPTWHYLHRPDQANPRAIDLVNDTDFAAHCNYLIAPDQLAGHIPVPPAGTENFNFDMYAAEDADHALTVHAIKYELFNANTHKYPYVLSYQPYQSSSAKTSRGIILGLKIEQSAIDGVTIPLPDPSINLSFNNSVYSVGSIPSRKIQPVIMNRELHNVVESPLRHQSPMLHDDIGISIRDASRVIVPFFDNRDVTNPIHPIQGLVFENHHSDPALGYTYTAWLNGNDPNIPDRSLTLWSSFRHTRTRVPNPRTISMYYTLTGLYGTNSIVSRHPNPALMLPNP